EAVAGFDPRREQAELLEAPGKVDRDPRALAQLRHLDLLLLPAQPGAPALRPLGGRRAELLADDAEREELVALETEDRDQALDVGFREESVLSHRPTRMKQCPALAIPHL